MVVRNKRTGIMNGGNKMEEGRKEGGKSGPGKSDGGEEGTNNVEPPFYLYICFFCA